jgi:hypothetical protein
MALRSSSQQRQYRSPIPYHQESSPYRCRTDICLDCEMNGVTSEQTAAKVAEKATRTAEMQRKGRPKAAPSNLLIQNRSDFGSVGSNTDASEKALYLFAARSVFVMGLTIVWITIRISFPTDRTADAAKVLSGATGSCPVIIALGNIVSLSTGHRRRCRKENNSSSKKKSFHISHSHFLLAGHR